MRERERERESEREREREREREMRLFSKLANRSNVTSQHTNMKKQSMANTTYINSTCKRFKENEKRHKDICDN